MGAEVSEKYYFNQPYHEMVKLEGGLIPMSNGQFFPKGRTCEITLHHQQENDLSLLMTQNAQFSCVSDTVVCLDQPRYAWRDNTHDKEAFTTTLHVLLQTSWQPQLTHHPKPL